MRNQLSALARMLGRLIAFIDLNDAFVFGGIGCVVVGVAQVYSPAAWIVVGAAMVWLGARR